MLRHIMEGQYQFGPEWDDISDSPQDLISKLLVVDPTKRLTATEALQNRFFESSDHNETRVMSPKRKFKAAILTVHGICRLKRYSAQRPIRIEAARANPYQHKPIRQLIDSLAFGIYGHWVKKGEGQNRAALFENSPKIEAKQAQLNMPSAGRLSKTPSIDVRWYCSDDSE